MLPIGVRGTAASADNVSRVGANVRAMAEPAAGVAYVDLPAVQRTFQQYRPVSHEIGHAVAIEGHDYCSGIGDALGGQC